MSFNNKQLHMNPQQSGNPVPADGLNPEENCQQLSPFGKEEHDG